MTGRARGPRSVRRGRTGELALLAAALVVGLALAEAVVRLVAPQTLGLWRSTRDGLVTLRPGLREAVSATGTRVSTNALGMRDGARDFSRTPGTYRILVLGDSFIEALQVEFDDAFSTILGHELGSATGRPIEVVTAGVSGWGTDDQLRWYRAYGSRFDVDLVLVAMTLHNDVSDNLEMQFSRYEDGRLMPRTTELPLHEFAALRIKGFLAARSHLYRLATGRLRQGRVEAQGDALRRDVAALLQPEPSARMALGWAMTKSLLDAFRREALARDAELAVALIPLAVQVDARDAASDAPQAVIRDWGRRSGTLVIDLLPGFLARRSAEPATALYLAGDGHWTQQGHATAAREVARVLTERVGSGHASSRSER